MSTWIKLNRNITKHWIFKDEWKFKCWVDLLLSANYSDKKVEIKGILFTCKRGELLYSLDSLSSRWNVNKSKVRRFLKLLESDSMIVIKSEQVTTRITICNYDSYQDERNADETQTKRKRNADETQTTPTKEYKEIKNNIISLDERKLKFAETIKPFVSDYGKDICKEFYLYWTEPNTSKTKLKFELQRTWDIKRRLDRWVKNDFNKPKKDINSDNSYTPNIPLN